MTRCCPMESYFRKAHPDVRTRNASALRSHRIRTRSSPDDLSKWYSSAAPVQAKATWIFRLWQCHATLHSPLASIAGQWKTEGQGITSIRFCCGYRLPVDASDLTSVNASRGKWHARPAKKSSVVAFPQPTPILSIATRPC